MREQSTLCKAAPLCYILCTSIDFTATAVCCNTSIPQHTRITNRFHNILGNQLMLVQDVVLLDAKNCEVSYVLCGLYLYHGVYTSLKSRRFVLLLHLFDLATLNDPSCSKSQCFVKITNKH